MSKEPPRATPPDDRVSGTFPGEGATGLKLRARLTGSHVGPYRLGARLAVGEAACVYLARLGGQHEPERIVAVEVVHEPYAEQPGFVQRFLEAARLAARLVHPNVVLVHESGRDGDVLFLVMEYLEGQPLSQLYRALAERGASLPPDVLAHVGARAAEGLHHAHGLLDERGARVGLVHGGVSPERVVVTYDGQVKVIDFGVAPAVGCLLARAVAPSKGRSRTLAPEQALGRPLDHRVDLFALAATLAEGAVGHAVLLGGDPGEPSGTSLGGTVAELLAEQPDVPAALSAALTRALAVDPAERPATAEAFARDLDAVVRESGRTDQRERLAEILADTFAGERRELGRALAALRVLDQLGEPPVRGSRSPGPVRRRRAGPVAALAAGVALAGVGVAVGFAAGGVTGSGAGTTRQGAAAGEGAPAAEEVTIDVALHPAVPATIVLDGVVVTERPARRRIPRGSRPLRLEVGAEGFAPFALPVIPDRDRAVEVALVHPASGEPPLVGAPSLARSPLPGPAPSGAVARGTSGAAEADPGAEPSTAAAPAGSPSESSAPPARELVTEHPF
ncbi:MAG TPA: protein kinase [Polyangiaceae bacterium]|nr:protein kinase [Polyangiaceae bacterium]